LYYDEQKHNITDNKIESDDDSNISVNIISKKTRSISFDSIESYKSNDVLLKTLGLESTEVDPYDSDDIEIISTDRRNHILYFINNKKYF